MFDLLLTHLLNNRTHVRTHSLRIHLTNLLIFEDMFSSLDLTLIFFSKFMHAYNKFLRVPDFKPMCTGYSVMKIRLKLHKQLLDFLDYSIIDRFYPSSQYYYTYMYIFCY